MIDANVIFDFAVGGLLDDLFRLPLEFCTPDLLMGEIVHPPADRLLALGLVVHTLLGEQLVEIITLRQAHPTLSQPDVAAFVLARGLGVGLITGDGRLRGLADTSGIEVHGTLWLLDEFEQQELITTVQARAELTAMQRADRRLPDHEVHARLRRWGQS